MFALNDKKAAVLVMLAFDTADHTILLQSLSAALAWFQFYLANRVQCIFFGCHSSGASKLVYGVPWGLVIGPILFTIYKPIGDICHHHGLGHHLFIDDSQLRVSFPVNSHEDLYHIFAGIRLHVHTGHQNIHVVAQTGLNDGRQG